MIGKIEIQLGGLKTRGRMVQQRFHEHIRESVILLEHFRRPGTLIHHHLFAFVLRTQIGECIIKCEKFLDYLNSVWHCCDYLLCKRQHSYILFPCTHKALVACIMHFVIYIIANDIISNNYCLMCCCKLQMNYTFML